MATSTLRQQDSSASARDPGSGRGHATPAAIAATRVSLARLLLGGLGLASAILAGIPKERILNFQPVEDVLAWARERRRRGASA